MILAALAAAALAVPALPPREIDRAIAMGRLDEARLMIEASVKAGASGAAIDRQLATLAVADGRNDEAMAQLTRLLVATPDDPVLLEQAALVSLKSGSPDDASAYADRAVRQPGASWRAWNIKGVLADAARHWDEADLAYSRAIALAGERAEIVNNRGWSHVLRGDWKAARDLFARAAALDPTATRIADNLDLAELALASDLPVRRDGETALIYAARLNDAGVAAAMRGDRKRARAAFAQAIVASGSWYARANANLAIVEERP